MKRFSGKLPIGTQVLYYPRSDIRAKVTYSTGPLIGFVHRCEDGMCDLIVFGYNGHAEMKRAVYHTSHPDMYDMHGNISGAAYRVGCWDFVDAHVTEVERFNEELDRKLNPPPVVEVVSNSTNLK